MSDAVREQRQRLLCLLDDPSRARTFKYSRTSSDRRNFEPTSTGNIQTIEFFAESAKALTSTTASPARYSLLASNLILAFLLVIQFRA
jgi:hypothetical protein